MARVLTSGAELNSLDTAYADGGLNATNITYGLVVTSPVRSGTYAYKFDSGGTNGNSYAITEVIITHEQYTRLYVNFPGWPTAPTGGIAIMLASDVGSGFAVAINASGQLSLWNTYTNTQLGSAVQIQLNTWVRVEMYAHYASTASAAEMQVDGVSGGLFTNENNPNSTTDTQNLRIGWGGNKPGANSVFYVDDIAVNSSAGADNNSWPGSGKVLLLLPTADSSVGTGWTDGAGGTSGIYVAVDNIPPAGVADASRTATSQIRNATNNLSAYAATMATYSSVGLIATDTINAVAPFIVSGSGTASATKTGSLTLSNPTLAKTSVGAFNFNTTAVATFGTGYSWRFRYIAAANKPSVTLGTAPVLTITQDTANTNITEVCFVGVYVDYTPAAAPPEPVSVYLIGSGL